MARRRGTYTLSSNIELEAGAPLDSRDIVQTKADLTNGSFPYAYVGMETYVISEGKKYRFIGEDPTDIEDWEEVGSGDSDLEFIEISEADYAELTTEEKNDPTKIYFRYEATGFFRDVQDDPNATAFQGTKIPTGRTVDSIVDDKLDDYMIKGTDYVTAGKKANTTLGANATAEGYNTTASGARSHAEGSGTTASGDYSHAEGQSTTASGEQSHAEGYTTRAAGYRAHAEGWQSFAEGADSHAEGWTAHAKGNQSHAEGMGTIASSMGQHVQGKYNVEDANGIYAHIVGNGTNSSNRSNIHTLDWSGNAWFAGDVTDGSGNVLSDKADNEPTFTEASTRANIASGESIPTILGKIKKFFTDLKDLAFISKDGDSSTKFLRGDGTWQEVTGGVSSVNSKTGAVILTASDVGALASNGTAAKATADSDGNTISSTYFKNGVGNATDGTGNRLAPFKVVTETEYAALTTAQKNNGTIYFRTGANIPMRPVQDDGTATDLVSGNLPTGQTIKSYLNSNLSNFLTIRSTTVTITRTNGSRSTVTAPTVTGYTFLCWLSAISSGWIGNIYIENPTQATSSIWSANYGYTDPASGNVNAFALYVKNM